jgi:hypothetical protein
MPDLLDHDVVPVAAAAARAWPGLPRLTRAGRVYVLDGEVLIARADGGFDRVVLGGRPHAGIAEDPCPGRRR